MDETRFTIKEYVEVSESIPKKAKTVLSAEKVMGAIFWDCRGKVATQYLKKGSTIMNSYFASPLDKLKDIIQAKC